MSKDQKINPSSGTASNTEGVPHIKAKGDVQIKIALIWVVGLVVVILTIGLVVALLWKPEGMKDYISSVAPIISPTLFIFIGFIVGQYTKQKD